ncbi:MAG TPA: hypothetical protein VK589_01625 [Chryseolinea sp.]|nr:hypothetical protein [Chryseolinea sp.]
MFDFLKLKLHPQNVVATLVLCGACVLDNSSSAQSIGEGSAYQGAYILNAPAYQKGVYRTFDEFKYNRPSIVDHYAIGKKAILITEGTGKSRKLKKHEVWGYCDGSRIFVRWRKFNELVEKGRYCYFKETGTRMTYVVSGIPLMIIPVPTPYKDEVIVNFNTGTSYRLTKKLMREILEADDAELLEMFTKERGKGKKLFDYVVKYNDRNTARIK